MSSSLLAAEPIGAAKTKLDAELRAVRVTAQHEVDALLLNLGFPMRRVMAHQQSER